MGLAPGLRVRTWHLVAVGVIAAGAVVAALTLSGWGPLGSQHATLVSAHKTSTTESLNPASALGVNAEESATPEATETPEATPAVTASGSSEMDEEMDNETESGDDSEMHATPSPTTEATPTPSATATAMPSASPTPDE